MMTYALGAAAVKNKIKDVSLLTWENIWTSPYMSQIAMELIYVVLGVTKFENTQYSCDFLEESQESKVVPCISACFPSPFFCCVIVKCQK